MSKISKKQSLTTPQGRLEHSDKLCMGTRVDGKPCTRQKKRGFDCCGIHCPKSPEVSTEARAPIPSILTTNTTQSTTNPVELDRYMVELTAVEVRGIIYYVDTAQHVYNIEDILDEKIDPAIIGTLIDGSRGKEFEAYVSKPEETAGNLCTIDSLTTTAR
jgi:hypothetical protein